jgi:glyoxylase-like metal-dependent hydrolase (beta-lactamase superfamily II)
MFPLFPRGTQSIIYCLLVETNDGLLLVDTGFGIRDYQQPTRFIKLFTASLGMPCSLEETAAYQVEELGYARNDVRHIVMTHMHSDHSGGLPDFPDAQVHVHELEYEAIQHPRGLMERFYEPAHWAHHPKWVIHNDADAIDWYGYGSIRVQKGLLPDVRLIPLPGHSRGHCGVAIETATGWLLHCGDATYPFYQENEPAPPFKPLPFYVMSPPRWLEKSLVGEHTAGLRALYEKHGEKIQFVCSNDSISYSMERK